VKEDIGLNLLEEEMSIIKHIYNIKEEPVNVKLFLKLNQFGANSALAALAAAVV